MDQFAKISRSALYSSNVTSNNPILFQFNRFATFNHVISKLYSSDVTLNNHILFQFNWFAKIMLYPS